MSKLLGIWLDGLPPSVNHLYRTSRGRMYMIAEAKTWQTCAASRFLFKRNKKHTPSDKPVAVRVIFKTPDKRHWDIDNRLKSLLDCLAKGGVIYDDAQIYSLEMHREIDKNAKNSTFIEVIEIC